VDFAEVFILGLYMVFLLFCAVALIYLVIRRVRLKEEEDFEKRDN